MGGAGLPLLPCICIILGMGGHSTAITHHTATWWISPRRGATCFTKWWKVKGREIRSEENALRTNPTHPSTVPPRVTARTGHSPLPKAITWQEKWISHEESKHIIGRKTGVRKANTLTLKPQWDHHGLEMRGSQPQTHLKPLRELWKHGANDALQQSTWLWISGGVGSSFR